MRKRLMKICLIVCAALIAAACIPFLIDVDRFRPELERELSRTLGRQVRIGHLAASPLSGGAEATDITIAEDPAFGSAPFLRAASLKLNVELWPLISAKKLIVTAVTVFKPEAALIENPSGEWNFHNLRPASEPASPSSLSLSAKRIDIAAGHFSISKTGSQAKPVILDSVNATLRDFSTSAAMPLALSARLRSGGDLEIKGTAGPLDPADASRTPFDVNATVSNVKLAASGFLDPANPMDGVLGFVAAIKSDGRVLDSQGRLKLEQAKFAIRGAPSKRALEFEFALDHDLSRRTTRIRTGNLRLGKALANITGTLAAQGHATRLDLHVLGSGMPVNDLVEMLRPFDIVLPAGSSVQGGTADLQLSIQGLSSAPISAGTATVNNTRLAGFDLGARLQSIAKFTGLKLTPNTDVERFHTSFREGPEGSAIDQITAIAPAIGELTGAGTINPDHALDFKMRAVVHTGGTVLAALGRKGDAAIPFFIRGSSANPEFYPDVAAIASKEMKDIPDQVERVRAFGDALQSLFSKKPK